MSGREQCEVVGVPLDRKGKGGRGEDLIEGVSDVLEFSVELVAVMLEPILAAFEQIRRKVWAVTGGITVGGDVAEGVGDQGNQRYGEIHPVEVPLPGSQLARAV